MRATRDPSVVMLRQWGWRACDAGRWAAFIHGTMGQKSDGMRREGRARWSSMVVKACCLTHLDKEVDYSMGNERSANNSAREAFERVGQSVSIFKGLPGGPERRGLDGACRIYRDLESDLEQALPFIGEIPEHGEKLLHLIYLLRGIANMSCSRE